MSGQRGQARLYCLVLVCHWSLPCGHKPGPKGVYQLVLRNRLGRVSNVSGLMLVRLRRRSRFL